MKSMKIAFFPKVFATQYSHKWPRRFSVTHPICLSLSLFSTAVPFGSLEAPVEVRSAVPSKEAAEDIRQEMLI